MSALTVGAQEKLQAGAGGTYSLARDALKHQLWDTRYFAATISDSTLFTQPINSPWRNSSFKTINETNMTDNGKLPNGQTFLIERFTVKCISYDTLTQTAPAKVLQAFVNILSSSVFTIKVPGREFDFQLPGTLLLPSVVGYGSGTVSTYGMSVGTQIASGSVKLDPTPIFLGNLIGFSVQHALNNPDSNIVTVLNTSTAALNTANSTLMIALEGFLTRAK